MITTSMNKVHALDMITKGLSNAQYFKETRSSNYDVNMYSLTCGTESPDKELERE